MSCFLCYYHCSDVRYRCCTASTHILRRQHLLARLSILSRIGKFRYLLSFFRYRYLHIIFLRDSLVAEYVYLLYIDLSAFYFWYYLLIYGLRIFRFLFVLIYLSLIRLGNFPLSYLALFIREKKEVSLVKAILQYLG